MRTIALTLIVLMIAGCHASQSQRYGIAVDTYNGAVSTMTTLAITDRIDDDTMLEFEMIRKEARELLDLWYSAIINSEPFDETWREHLSDLLDRMIRMQANDGSGSTTHNIGGDENDRHRIEDHVTTRRLAA